MLSSIEISNSSEDSVSCQRSNLEGNSEDPALIFVSKNWLLPSRPKPGRKPSKDPPLTKRKAQNREAQRAFCQRRATRILELETSIKELQDLIKKLKQEHLQKIQYILLENEQLKKENVKLQEENLSLKSKLEKSVNYLHFDSQRNFSPLSIENFPDIHFGYDVSMKIKDFPSSIIGQSVPLKKKKNNFQKTKNIEFEDISPNDEIMENADHSIKSENLHNVSNYIKYQKSPETGYKNQIDTNTSFNIPFIARNDSVIEENGCGFCTGNPDICLCFQSQDLNNEMRNMIELDKNILPPILVDDDIEKDNGISKFSEKTEKLKILEPSSYMVQNEYEPGSCAQCKADSLKFLNVLIKKKKILVIIFSRIIIQIATFCHVQKHIKHSVVIKSLLKKISGL